MTHEELRDLYELYVLGVLEQDEKAEIEGHLSRGCEECNEGLRSAIGITSFLATLPEPVQPRKQLRQRVLASVQPTPRAIWSWSWPTIAAAACLLVAILVSRDAINTHQQLVIARQDIEGRNLELGRYRQALDVLNQPDTEQVTFGKGPRGRVFVSQQRGVLFIASNLPPAAAGKIYEMWIIPKTGAPKPAGLFQSDAQNNALHLLPGPLDRRSTSAIAVTVEPEAGSPGPTTTPIIVAALTD
ncbi:MAG TPA: anti-sigma factor [Bryobacteraceae bacterium]|nr:anti-sigma factor [Bryobacteraceae bacterium]